MSMDERTGVRDLSYSRWHRPASMRRFVDHRTASMATVIDIDWCEYCCLCSEPLALIETQAGDRPPKSAKVTVKLAKRAGLPAFSVSFVKGDDGDVTAFRWRMLHPTLTVERRYTPGEYALFITELRHGHDCELG